MKLMKEIKNNVGKKLLYADIELLELFQSSLLIFVNPFNLMAVDCFECTSYLLYLAFPSFLIGALNLIAVFYNANINRRLRIARIHWSLCVVILAVLTFCEKIHVGDGLLSYYLVQCIFCAFIIIRLNSELLHKKYRDRCPHE